MNEKILSDLQDKGLIPAYYCMDRAYLVLIVLYLGKLQHMGVMEHNITNFNAEDVMIALLLDVEGFKIEDTDTITIVLLALFGEIEYEDCKIMLKLVTDLQKLGEEKFKQKYKQDDEII